MFYIRFMRIFSLLVFIFLSFKSYSQNTFSKQLSLLTDNDLYTSTYRDRYYTSGLFVTLRSISNTANDGFEKKIHSYEIGHMMYTPSKPNLSIAIDHDRPFAGYLYGQYGQTRVYNSENILKIHLQIGVIGSHSKAKELQNFIHSIYNFPDAAGWKHQIQNAFAINLNSTYLKYLPKISSSHFDLSSYNMLKLGTIFANISTGFYARIGTKQLEKPSNSVAFNTNLNKQSGQNNAESFFNIKPMITYAAYDATIQGSFLNQTSPVTFDVMPFHFSLELGYTYYYNRFQYGYTYHFHTKKLKSSRATRSNTYGSLRVGYYFD